MKVLPLPSRPYLICSIVLPCALATPGRGQMTRVRTSLLTRRLKREKERCEDKPLGNTYLGSLRISQRRGQKFSEQKRNLDMIVSQNERKIFKKKAIISSIKSSKESIISEKSPLDL